MMVSAIYCPPKHKITSNMFKAYFDTLGCRFVVGGDFNAKHEYWGSRNFCPRGRQLKICIDALSLRSISTGDPTYWPTDSSKLPNLLDFFVTKGVDSLYTTVESILDGSSDHTPVVLTMSTTITLKEKPEALHNSQTDWDGFRDYIDREICLRVPLKTADDVDDACVYITNLIQVAAWSNTPEVQNKTSSTVLPNEIKQKIAEKRRLRRIWQQTRHPHDRTLFNRAIKELRKTLHEVNAAAMKNRLQNISSTGKGVYSLWNATKSLNKSQKHSPPLKTPCSWARTDSEKAETFAKHLATVFKPNETSTAEHHVSSVLNEDLQLCLPIKPTSPRELIAEINQLNPKKAPGFDLITPVVLKQLPRKCITFLTCLFNAILRCSYFPNVWKISQIIMLHKSGKPIHEVSSYRPISLTPVLSKLWEKIFLHRLKKAMDECDIIPTHQFGFRSSHSTVEQTHRVYEAARQSLERKEYCSAAFLDVQQAFDRVWHQGLLCKVKEKLPHSFFSITKSYIEDRLFRVKQGEQYSSLYRIEAGVPQGSVLGPVLYNIFTCDMPVCDEVVVATYADDMAYLASDKNPEVASAKLQKQLNVTHSWLNKWRIRVSSHKSNHITFTLNRSDCPAVKLGDENLPHSNTVKYLGFHLDRKLTWKEHIKHKRDQIMLNYKSMLWLMGRNSSLSVDNKLLIYNVVLKPIWTYGLQLWGTASRCNIMALQRAQNIILKAISGAPWFIRNDEVHSHLQVRTIAQELETVKNKYSRRLAEHPNALAVALLDTSNAIHRLKRSKVL